LEGIGHGLIEVLSWHLPGGSEESYEDSVRIAVVISRVQTEHLLSANLEPFHYSSLHSFRVLKSLMMNTAQMTIVMSSSCPTNLSVYHKLKGIGT
jgi:hypothetical protein